MKRILVTGADGQLGQCLASVQTIFPSLAFTFKTRETLDITDADAVTKVFESNQYDILVNAAAYTAVDKAESDEEVAYAVNVVGTKILAEISNQYQVPLVHISTDYVFDGSVATPRLETDQTNPIGVYGRTKLEGEQFALEINPKTVIIRTAWVYSRFGNNFVKTMLRLFKERDELGVINDQIGSPTNAIDLAKVIGTICEKEELTYGIFNYSNEGECSWFEFASKIKDLVNAEVIINPIPTSAYPTPAKRPAYSLLNKTKIKETYSIFIPNWEDSLEEELRFIP